jgi:hypothetical protein
MQLMKADILVGQNVDFEQIPYIISIFHLAGRGIFSAIWGEKKLLAALAAEKYPFPGKFQTFLYAYGAVSALQNFGKSHFGVG